MLKRLVPIFTLLLTILLDTAILPVFYSGTYQLPLSLVAVILLGIQLGRLSGMLYGMIAGLLLDISVGTLGMKLFPYIVIGFLTGFFLDAQPEISRSMSRKDRLQLIAVRAIWIGVLLLIYEIVMLVYQYFNTAVFEWSYVLQLILRTLLMDGLCLALYSLFHRLYFGSEKRAQRRTTREVKNF